jgi:predicted GIY-YIG superfamily endonuclease
MSEPDINWEGVSGKKYGYWIHKIRTEFKDEPGSYIYAKETKPNSWAPVYIGQTSSLKNRLADHEKENCAKRNGATHIHAHTSSNTEETGKAEEIDLIRNYRPVCNEHHT